MKFKLGFAQKDTWEHNARIDHPFKRNSVIIHHYCPHTYNAGDHFVIHSIRKHIKKHLPQAVFIPRSIAVNRGWGAPHRLQGPNIAFSNRYADAVLVGGSDNYRNWSLRIDGEEIQHLRPPLFLIGLGISSNNLNEAPLIQKEKYMDDIRSTNEKAALSTVRDQATWDFLTGFGVDKAIMTGCPALYLGEVDTFEFRENGPLLLTFPFPVNKKKMPERFKMLQKVIHEIARKYEHVILSCHDDRDVGPATELFPDLAVFFSNNWNDYVDLYGKARMVVGSRLHGTILAASLGTPFLNINVDIRGQSFDGTFGLENWNLDYTTPNLSDQIIDKIERVCKGELAVFDAFQLRKNQLAPVFHQSMEAVARTILARIG